MNLREGVGMRFHDVPIGSRCDDRANARERRGLAPLPRSTERVGQALLGRSGPVLTWVAVVPLPFSGASERAHPLSCS